MNKLLATLLLGSFCSVVSAQTGGLPPEQAPAGSPGKFQSPKQIKASNDSRSPTTDSSAVAKPATAADRRAARKAKREAKVGDKPLD